jgi:hypothetical protein
VLTITIETDNAAFEHHCGTEVARILHKLADKIKLNDSDDINHISMTLQDVNGNTVGVCEGH